jgi:hypothetical protein
MSIRSRIGIPGGTSGFDLPAYYAGDPATRRHDLEAWAGTLGPLAESIFLLLAAARFGLAAESGGRTRPVPADPAARAQLPAAAPAPEPGLGLIPKSAATGCWCRCV